MKWIGLHVEGFGKLSDFRCSFDAPVTVIYGPNEAGKSTMLGFIRSMLYGFATRANPSERQEPSAGGRHGGRLLFRDSLGRAYVLERLAKTAGGKLSVRPYEGQLAEGQQNDTDVPAAPDLPELPELLLQGAWEQVFLGGVNERVYRQLFAITLTELQAVGMLEGDELGKQLYHAGWGGGQAIARTEKQLNAQLDGLFRPRGSNQQMNRLIKELDDTETQLRRLEDEISSYNDLADELVQTQKQLQELESRLPAMREQAALLARAHETRPLWIGRMAFVRELEDLNAAGRLPSDMRRRWELWTVEHDRTAAALRDIKLKADGHERGSRSLIYDEKLIEAVEEIEALLMSVERMNAVRLERKALEAELREHSEALSRLLSRIAPDWTEHQLRLFRFTVADRETVRAARAAMTDAARASHLAEAELRSTREQTQEVEAQLAEIEETAGGRELFRRGGSPAGTGSQQRGQLHGSDQEATAAVRMADFGGAELLPATPEGLRHAARTFEDAWRELELEQLRAEQAQQGAASASAAGHRGGAALWAAAGALAAAAAALLAAGWPTAAAAAASAALAIAALALLRLREARQAAPRAGAAPARARRGGPHRAAAGPAPSAAAAAMAPLAAAERRVAAALRGLVSEPEALLAALLANREAATGRSFAPDSEAYSPAAAAPTGADKQHAASRAYIQEAAAAGAAVSRAVSGGGMHRQPVSPSALLEQLRAAIDARLDQLRAGQHSAQRRRELQRRLASLAAQETEQRLQQAQAAEQEQAAAANWHSWLAAQALPLTLSPEAAIETADLAEQAALRLQARDRLIAKAADMDTQLADFEAAVRTLGSKFPDVRGTASAEPGLALKLMHSEAGKQTAAQARLNELTTEIARLRNAETSLVEALHKLDDERETWFAAVSADNERGFLEAVKKSERLQEIEPELYKLAAELDAGVTSAQRERLEQWFQFVDAARLAAMKLEAESALASGERLRSELLETSGRQRQSMEQLMQAGSRTRLLAQREETSAALKQLMDRYAVAALSMTMIRRTKRLMEEQRQPAVLKEASRYMAKMSKGKYTRISVPEGEQTIRLETPDGQFVDSIFLSRGTAEQLYLSMRFALADEAAMTTELPMILDDLFVNFDGSRLEAAIDIIGELSSRRQLVLLTCHDHIRDKLMEQLSSARLVHLS